MQEEEVMPVELVIYEIKRLVEGYYKCPYYLIKEQIFFDIILLKDALSLLNIDHDLETPPKPIC